MGNRKSQQEEFYEKVYGGFDVEEVYDIAQRTPTVNLADESQDKAVAANPLYEKVDIDLPEDEF